MTISHATFSPEFATWLETAPMDDLMDAYVENYKDAHGIKARWMYGNTYTRQEFADMFVQLGADIKAENDREETRAKYFMAQVESIGLGEWAKANKIRNEDELWYYEMDHSYPMEDAPALPYEAMAIQAGF